MNVPDVVQALSRMIGVHRRALVADPVLAGGEAEQREQRIEADHAPRPG